jgi:hypothetical protein
LAPSALREDQQSSRATPYCIEKTGEYNRAGGQRCNSGVSIKGNDLEQWRAYANNGRGYAIGFDGRMLETAFSQRDGKPIQEHMTFPVSYDEAKLQDIFRQLIAKVMPLISAPANMSLSSAVIESYM